VVHIPSDPLAARILKPHLRDPDPHPQYASAAALTALEERVEAAEEEIEEDDAEQRTDTENDLRYTRLDAGAVWDADNGTPVVDFATGLPEQVLVA